MKLLKLMPGLCVAVLLGCGGGTSSTGESGSNSESGQQTDAATGAANLETTATVTSTEGRWLLTVMRPEVLMPGLVVDLAEGQPPKVVATSPFMPPVEVKDSTITATTVDATFVDEAGTELVVTAVLHNQAAIRGSITSSNGACNYVELVPTELAAFPEDLQQSPTEGIRLLSEKMKNNEQFSREQALALIAKIGTSPTTMAVYQSVLQDDVTMGASVEQLLADADSMLVATEPWGAKKQEEAARSVLAFLAPATEVPVAKLREWIERTEGYGGENPDSATTYFVNVAKAAAAVRDDETPIEVAQEAVEQVRERSPFDPMTYEFRKRLADRADDDKQRLEIAVEQIALPIPGGDKTVAEELFTKVHGSAEGFEAYVRSVYDEKLLSFGDKEVDPKNLGESPVLIELFTGGSCGPCVAADAAIAAVEESYPDHAVVVRYHMNIPAADPLATATGNARYDAYQQLPGTPSVVINGIPRQIPGLAGPYQLASTGYQNLSRLVELISNEPAPISVSAIAASDSELIRVIATADGLPENLKANLVVVLAAKELNLDMPNGIRSHGMVARALPAGVVGIGREQKPEIETSLEEANSSEAAPTETQPVESTEEQDTTESEKSADAPKDSPADESTKANGAEATGSFDIVAETTVTELKEKLVASLSVPEEAIEQHKDVITDLSDLVAVVFLQDTTTGAVLAVKRVPVMQVDAIPDIKAAAGASKAKNEDESKTDEKPEAATDAAKPESAAEPAKPSESPEAAAKGEPASEPAEPPSEPAPQEPAAE